MEAPGLDMVWGWEGIPELPGAWYAIAAEPRPAPPMPPPPALKLIAILLVGGGFEGCEASERDRGEWNESWALGVGLKNFEGDFGLFGDRYDFKKGLRGIDIA